MPENVPYPTTVSSPAGSASIAAVHCQVVWHCTRCVRAAVYVPSDQAVADHVAKPLKSNRLSVRFLLNRNRTLMELF